MCKLEEKSFDSKRVHGSRLRPVGFCPLTCQAEKQGCTECNEELITGNEPHDDYIGFDKGIRSERLLPPSLRGSCICSGCTEVQIFQNHWDLELSRPQGFENVDGERIKVELGKTAGGFNREGVCSLLCNHSCKLTAQAAMQEAITYIAAWVRRIDTLRKLPSWNPMAADNAPGRPATTLYPSAKAPGGHTRARTPLSVTWYLYYRNGRR